MDSEQLTTPTKVAIHGAAGRMGQRLIALGSQDPRLRLVAALESESHPRLGQDAGQIAGVGDLGLPLTSQLPAEVDAVIDFSVPEACEAITRATVERRAALVMATTGLTENQQQAVREAAEHTAVVWAPNMSLAVNLTMKLTEVAAAALAGHGSGVDVEILERHHRFKEDAPSGTALRFGELIAAQMGHSRHVHGREGRPGVRPRDEIGYHAIRVGDNPGEHTIVFGMLGEMMELTVRATSRDSYASGALEAAVFAHGKPPGLYSMYDVLGL